VPKTISGIEPDFERVWSPGVGFIESNCALFSWLKALSRGCKYRRIQLRLLSVENLNNIAITAKVEELENVRPGGENDMPGYLHRRVEGKYRQLVELIRLGRGAECRD